MRIGYQVDIEAPVERVWHFVEDPARWPLWMPELHSMSWTRSAGSSPVGAGVRQIYRGRGSVVAREGEITAYEVCQRFAMRFTGPGLTTDVEVQFGPMGTGTCVIFDEMTISTAWPPRLRTLLWQPFELRRLSHRMACLKKLAEDAAFPRTED